MLIEYKDRVFKTSDEYTYFNVKGVAFHIAKSMDDKEIRVYFIAAPSKPLNILVDGEVVKVEVNDD